MKFPAIISLFLLLCCSALLAQGTGRKPVLIRPNKAEARKENAPVKPDPAKALHSVEVGDFYFKKDNYKAAENRYREAIRYNPKLADAYDRLVRALEKQSKLPEAAKVCQEFVDTNPASDQVGHFQKLAGKISTKIEKDKK